MGYLDEDDRVEGQRPLGEHHVEALGLAQGTGKAVHHKAIARLLERVEDQLDDQVVGHELAVFEQLAD